MTVDVAPWSASRVWVLISVLLASSLVAVRLAVAPFRWGMWAEDGTVFLAAAWLGDWAVWTPYAGYLHVVPRSLAVGVAQVPVPWAAGATVVVTGIVAAVCGYVCARRLRAVLTVTWTRCAVAAFMVASPAVMAEVGGNLSNLHWFLTGAAVIMLWAPATGRTGWRDWSGAAVCLAAGLSDPLAALALIPVGFVAAPILMRRPLAGSSRWGCLRRAVRPVALPLTALLLALSAQFAAALSNPRPTAGSPDPFGLAYLWMAYTGPRSLLGPHLAAALAARGPDLLVLIGSLAAVCTVWVLAAVNLRHHRFGSLAVTAVLPSLLALAANWNPVLLEFRFPYGTGRYAYVGALLTIIAALALAQLAWRSLPGLVGRAASGLMVMGMVANLLHGGSYARDWAEGVASVPACRPGELVWVPIDPPGWNAEIPCDEIEQPVPEPRPD